MSILKHRLLGSGVTPEDLEAYEGDYGTEELEAVEEEVAPRVPSADEVALRAFQQNIVNQSGYTNTPKVTGEAGPTLSLDEELATNPNTGEDVEVPMLNSTRFAKLQGLMPKASPVAMQDEAALAVSSSPVDPGPSPEALAQAAQPSAIGSMLASMASSPNRQSMVDAAQAERRAALQRADIERIGESLRAGLGSAQGINKYDPSDEQAKRIEKLGDLAVTEVKEDMTLKPEEDMQDPNSAISAQYRELAAKLYKGKIPEGISAAQLQSALPMLQEIAAAETNKRKDEPSEYQRRKLELEERLLDLRQGREGRLTEKFDFTRSQKFQDDAGKELDRVRKTKAYEDSAKSLSSLTELELLLDDAKSKGGQSLAMLGPRIAKGIAGEVGVLTEADVTRYVRNPSLIPGALDTFQKLKDGKITEASYNNIKRMMSLIKEANTAKMNDALDKQALLFSRREDIPYEEARYLIDPAFQRALKPTKETKTESTGYTEAQERGISKVMQANDISREKAIDALKAAGKLK